MKIKLKEITVAERHLNLAVRFNARSIINESASRQRRLNFGAFFNRR